ncbi:MAG: cytochrome P450 [Candidatus Eisenbacteria bacterium]
MEELVLGDAAIMIQDDPPAHTRLRNLLEPFFSRSGLAQLGVDVRAVAHAELTTCIGRNVDFVEAVAARIALRVIGGLLGLPPAELDYLREWTNHLSEAVGLEFVSMNSQMLAGQALKVRALHEELSERLTRILHDSRGTNGAGMIRASLDWPLEDAERVGLIKSVAFAGNHTSAILQSNAVELLARWPAQFARVQRREVSIAGAANEVLRMKGTFRGITRVATANSELRGTKIARGDYLIAWLTSANWDDRVFADAAMFDVGRAPNRHVAFALGPHHCIGARIARMELEAVIEVMCEHVARVEVTNDPTPIGDPWVDGWEHLEVNLCR